MPKTDDVLPARPTRGRMAGKALVINIFGGPGSGKTTLAARLFSEFKERGVEAAQPEEHAKLAIWSGQPWLLDEQVVLLGRTWETLHALSDKVDVIIVDSPILLCSVYARDREPSAFHSYVAHLHTRTDRLNLLLDRDPDLGYSTNGRRENAHEALVVDQRIMQGLDAIGEHFVETGRGAGDIERIVAAARGWLRAREGPVLDLE